MTSHTLGRAPDSAACSPLVWLRSVTAEAMILTLDGERPVAALRPGTRVITRDRGAVALRAVTQKPVIRDAVQIKAGSLGHMRPVRDVLLPQDQPLLIRDWRAKALFGSDPAIVAARRLVDGEFVTFAGPHRFDACDLGLDNEHVLYVDGLELVAQALHSAG